MARKDEEQEGGLLGVYGRMFTQARRAVMLGFVLATSLQLTGINAIMYYGPTIFQNAGFDSPNISLIATVSNISYSKKKFITLDTQLPRELRINFLQASCNS
jgi:hypothetical protein